MTPAAGHLLGTNNTSPASVNLSTEGSADWAHWALTNAASFNHKSGITQQISNYTRIGPVNPGRFVSANQFTSTWTGGTHRHCDQHRRRPLHHRQQQRLQRHRPGQYHRQDPAPLPRRLEGARPAPGDPERRQRRALRHHH
ncbi:MAG: hypothetical protein IPK65_00485 [Gammaproteobacteria bacterium]|nr:hypothetical protein [Gammaproteobacteria bacterium]